MKLPRLIREAESGRAVELTRRGEGVAVLIGWKEYEHLMAKSRRFSEAWDEFRRKVRVAEFAIDPDDLFAARDDAPGRDTKL